MDATIHEGNVGRNFSPVDKLKIDIQSNGGESFWVPEDSVQLDDLHTQDNGTYYASSRGIYGWDTIIVDVDTSINGDVDEDDDDFYDDEDYLPEDLDPDDWDEEPDVEWYDDEDLDDGISGIDPYTGDDIYIYPGDDWEIEEEILPESIGIVLLPNKLEYLDGDSIDITGMYVYAYEADGHVWRGGGYRDGRVPNSELTIDPTVAHSDGSGSIISIDGELVGEDGHASGNFDTWYDEQYFYVYYNGIRLHNSGWDRNPIYMPRVITWYVSNEQIYLYITYPNAGPSAPNKIIGGPYDPDAIGMRVGRSGGSDRITVSWPRYGDGKVLTTEFSITVERQPTGGHWGGTTISGDYVGSHYSGKF